MKIQTFSIVAGSEACNARCPFCISKMTVANGVELREPKVNWVNFHKACRLAEMAGCTTAMLTGKGEPTLFPAQITSYFEQLRQYRFPIIELQTNGIPIATGKITEQTLIGWQLSGLSTVAISVVHYNAEKNRQIYTPYAKEYIDLPALIKKLHDLGLSVRLACVMLHDFIDCQDRVMEMVEFARANKVEQLTLRPVNKPDFERSQNKEAYDWTAEHTVHPDDLRNLELFFNGVFPFKPTKLMSLMHGATVYDINGQNVCLTGCLTREPDSPDIRQLIFFPDGHLRYDWQYEGAIIL